MKYIFIKISNNKNSSKDFDIIVTKIQNPNLKMSSLKSQWKRHLEFPDEYGWRELYRFFYLDYSFYKVDTEECEDYESAKSYKNYLRKYWFEKMNPTCEELFREYCAVEAEM